MKKKLLAKIFIPILALGILVAPISPILKFENGKINLENIIKKAEAEDIDFITPPPIPTVKANSKSATLTGTITALGSVDKVEAYKKGIEDVFFQLVKATQGDNDPFGNGSPVIYPSKFKDSPDFKAALAAAEAQVAAGQQPDALNPSQTITLTTPSELEPETLYAVRMILRDTDHWWDPTDYGTIMEVSKGTTTTFMTLAVGAPGDADSGSSNISVNVSGSDTTDFHYQLNCGLFSGTNMAVTAATTLAGIGPIFGAGINLGACVAQLTYTLWELAAPLARLAGSLLDYFVYYSTNGSSYTSEFLTIAWGTIRDIANIFFIIALLYIAIKTILNLNVSNNKRLIGAIIIAALLINFSFFITEVVIDASNILAKVFYNQIQADDQTGSQQVNLYEQTPITERLVANLDPMSIVGVDVYTGTNGIAIFNLVAWLALGITLYMAWIFVSVAFIFIARVISLWLCIIFSPFAFASYSLPFKIPGIGNQDWWNMLVKNAFLAPIFIFFLYVTVLFTEKFPQTITAQFTDPNTSTMAIIMKSLIPILLCFVLLTKGKKLAIEWSGDMGKGVNKVAGFATGTIGVKYVGGFLASKVGAAGRATIGAGASAISKSNWANNTALGRFVKNKITNPIASSSMDIRGAGGYKKIMGAMGVKDVGKAGGQGGYTQSLKNKKQKREEATEQLKQNAAKPEQKELMAAQQSQLELNKGAAADLQALESKQVNAEKEQATRRNQRLALESEKKAVEEKNGKGSFEKIHPDKQALLDKTREEEQMFASQVMAFKENTNAIKQGRAVNEVLYKEINKLGNVVEKTLGKKYDLAGNMISAKQYDPKTGKLIVDNDFDYSKDLKDANGKIIRKALLNDKGQSISELEKVVIPKIKGRMDFIMAEVLEKQAKSYLRGINGLLGGFDLEKDTHKMRMQQKLYEGTPTNLKKE